MSVAYRKIARLPLDIFTDLNGVLNVSEDERKWSPEQLRTSICKKLKSFRRKTQNGVIIESIDTVSELLEASTVTVLQALDPLLTYSECRELVKRICCHCAPKPTTAWNLWDAISSQPRETSVKRIRPVSHLPTGLKALDDQLGGGVRIGSLTEIVGKAGVGKSQFCMQLCIMAARYGRGCIYIDTEMKLSLPRLHEMAAARELLAKEDDRSNVQTCRLHNPLVYDRLDESNNTGGVSSTEPYDCNAQEVLENVSVMTATSTNELLSALKTLEEIILMRNSSSLDTNSALLPVGLLIIDSIAAPVRKQNGSETATKNTSTVLQCAQILKRLAEQLDLAVVVINQIATSGDADYQASTKAALGTAWHHCLSSRILLEYGQANTPLHECEIEGSSSAFLLKSHRRITVVKSNFTPKGGKMNFFVTPLGLESGIDDRACE